MKAIETSCKGYLFRSRLEARWAVFFDALGVRYEYEKEGFEFGDGLRYLPDFYISKHKWWIEIKPEEPSKTEIEKCQLLASGLDEAVYMIVGQPYAESDNSYIVKTEYHIIQFSPCGYLSGGNIFKQCVDCGKYIIENIDNWDEFERIRKSSHVPCDSGWGTCPTCEIEKLSPGGYGVLLDAYHAARSARFEYGQLKKSHNSNHPF